MPSSQPSSTSRSGRVVAAVAIAGLGLAACGDGPAAPNYGYEPPGSVRRGEAYQDNPKDSVTLAPSPRDLATAVGCAGFSPVFANRVGESVGTCRLQGRQLRLVAFADNEAQQAYLDTHRDTGVYVVGERWAVQAPTRPLAQQVQQRAGGSLAAPAGLTPSSA